MEDPKNMDNDLEERLLSIRNMIDLALLAFENNRHELLPTAIEEVFAKSQWLVDEYCIEDK